MKIRLVAVNARYILSCPAVFYVREELSRRLPRGEIDILQCHLGEPFFDILLKITDGRPEAVFFSAYVWNAPMVAGLARGVLAALPGVAVVVGGPEAEQAAFGIPCTVVEGEVEGLPRTFYQDLAAGTLQKHYHSSPAPSFSLPYREEDFGRHLINRDLYYESSRGCPFSCSYCCSARGKGVRFLPLTQVREELAFCLAHSPRMIRFVDRTFNADRARARLLWEFLAARPEKTVFHFEVAPDLIGPEELDLLSQVPPGRFRFEIGLQSVHPRVLAAVNRKMDPERALQAVRNLAALGNIHLHLDLILGLPHETASMFRESFNRAFGCGVQYLQMGLLKLLPGTPLAREAARFAMAAGPDPPYPLLKNRWLTHEELAYLYRFGECVEAFHNNRWFPTLWRYLRRSCPDPFAFFEDLMEQGAREGLFERAPTQEFLTGVLAQAADRFPERELLLEILRFDWLASGKRHLLCALGQDRLQEEKERLWKTLPQSLPPLFDPGGRKGFFKRSVFMRFHRETLETAGLEPQGETALVAFHAKAQGRAEPMVVPLDPDRLHLGATDL